MPRIPGLDVLREVEVRAVQAGFCVVGESARCWEAYVAVAVDPVGDVLDEVVDGFGDGSGRGYVGDWRGEGFPLVAGGVEDWEGVC